MALCTLLSGTVSGNTATTGFATAPPEPEFRFMRLRYHDNYMGYPGGSWLTDTPYAEYHLSQGIRRLTRIDTIDPDKLTPAEAVFPREPLDPDLFNHPFLYAVEVGRWYLDDEEAARIREYLDRGGFLVVDDFHGDEQWEGFIDSFHRIFPDKTVEEIPPDSEVFHVLFDLTQKVRDKVQIPGSAAWRFRSTCEECERGGAVPHWRGVYDDNHRLMAVINFNMDLGDSWELADDPEYPQPLTALGYRFGTSYALYAMTH
ncbi:MAG TPA: DUF4159 domain-containing protein [Steroidobacteraceae bacterium]|nr:DUF4159 domain-containing protein [Steroidobacteraceae bacterium]